MPTPRRRVDPARFLSEHRAIQAAVHALQDHVRVADPIRRDHWLRRLAEDLDVLAGLLRPHFAREEADGMFAAIAEAAPESAGECARLREQHGALLDRLAALREALDRSRHDARTVDSFRRYTRETLADLAHHEAVENALLIRVMEGEEVGTAD